MGVLEDQLDRLAKPGGVDVVPALLGRGLTGDRRTRFDTGTGDIRLLVSVMTRENLRHVTARRAKPSGRLRLNTPDRHAAALTICFELATPEQRRDFFPSVPPEADRATACAAFVDMLVHRESGRAKVQRDALSAVDAWLAPPSARSIEPIESPSAPAIEPDVIPPAVEEPKAIFDLIAGATTREALSLFGLLALLAVAEFSMSSQVYRAIDPRTSTLDIIGVATTMGLVLTGVLVALFVVARRMAGVARPRFKPVHLRRGLVGATLLVHLIGLLWLEAPPNVGLVVVAALPASFFAWRLKFIEDVRYTGHRLVPLVEIVLILGVLAITGAENLDLALTGVVAIALFAIVRGWDGVKNRNWNLLTTAI